MLINWCANATWEKYQFMATINLVTFKLAGKWAPFEGPLAPKAVFIEIGTP
jgi:hypothetical protein